MLWEGLYAPTQARGRGIKPLPQNAAYPFFRGARGTSGGGSLASRFTSSSQS
jgi:hypothetical protein